MAFYFSAIMLKIQWSVWVPIVISIASLISTIILNIYNRKAIRKDNIEMFDRNIENEKRNQRIKSYEEALLLLESPTLKETEKFNINKILDINDDFKCRVHKVLYNDLLLLDEDDKEKIFKKINKLGDGFSTNDLADELRNIAVMKIKQLKEETKAVIK